MRNHFIKNFLSLQSPKSMSPFFASLPAKIRVFVFILGFIIKIGVLDAFLCRVQINPVQSITAFQLKWFSENMGQSIFVIYMRNVILAVHIFLCLKSGYCLYLFLFTYHYFFQFIYYDVILYFNLKQFKQSNNVIYLYLFVAFL